MKSRAALSLAFAIVLCGAEWQTALPGYRYQFPRDHFSHPGYQTEWWYYTGNLRASDGHRFGFELTFFRQASTAPRELSKGQQSIWDPLQVYLAHLALSDIDGREFFHTERLNRAGPGLAGVNFEQHRYWNGNWQVRWTDVSAGKQILKAVTDPLMLELEFVPEKPFVINGQNGISEKGPYPGQASHYVSFTRLHAKGDIHWKGAVHSVEGLAWMDHEFFTEPSDSTLAGWDWFAIQLNNREELMLYRLRRKSGVQDPYSSGTYVDALGQAHFLSNSQFLLIPGQMWTSSESGARYPVSWNITVPCLQLELQENADLKSQELFTKGQHVTAPYWEGAVTFAGHMQGQPVEGLGYLEMTGYREVINLGER